MTREKTYRQNWGCSYLVWFIYQCHRSVSSKLLAFRPAKGKETQMEIGGALRDFYFKLWADLLSWIPYRIQAWCQPHDLARRRRKNFHIATSNWHQRPWTFQMTFHNNLGCLFINPFHVNAKRSWSNFTTTILVHDWWNIWNKAKPTVIQLLVIRLLPEIALFAIKGCIISLSLNMIMSY